ncbi:MAG: DUF805 domain-containing protein [Hyphomicrobiaceae bacterium]
MSLFFSFSGRASRSQWWTVVLAVAAAAALSLWGFVAVAGADTTLMGPAAGRLTLASLAMMAVLSWSLVAISARRLRDIGWPPALAVLAVVPYVGLAGLALGVVPPGTARRD